ncbi:MAG: hypothetical protein ACR2P9_03030 [Gammaproteobacteria bacterium]
MHFKVFVEDESGKRVLDVLIGKIIGSDHTFKVYPYRGMGRTPENLKTTGDPKKRILLQRLPKILQGLGDVHAGYSDNYSEAVVVVCDLDRKDRDEFLQELLGVLNQCNPRPEVRFCLAIEEGEAWLLGDIPAIKAAYPRAKNRVLNSYKNDSICGTWELLANAVYKGGVSSLKTRGRQAVGAEKSRWAEEISPHMDVNNNASPSFNYFRKSLLGLIQ